MVRSTLIAFVWAQGFKSIAAMRRFVGLSTSVAMKNRLTRCLEGRGDIDDLYAPKYWNRQESSKIFWEFGFLLKKKAKEIGICPATLTNRLQRVRNGQRDMAWALRKGHHKRGGRGYDTSRGNSEWDSLGDVER